MIVSKVRGKNMYFPAEQPFVSFSLLNTILSGFGVVSLTTLLLFSRKDINTRQAWIFPIKHSGNFFEGVSLGLNHV
ncbi:hypothetical protein HHX47_DHR2000984 [Lentinula edodes]|nr:hypothetical protein HHX47_DHR2000984 [Lentinula edodes]